MAYFTGDNDIVTIATASGWAYCETGKSLIKVGSNWYALVIDQGTPTVYKSSDFNTWININLPSPGSSGYRGTDSTLATDGTNLYYIDWIYGGVLVDVPCFSKYDGTNWTSSYITYEPSPNYYNHSLSAGVLSDGTVYIVAVYRYSPSSPPGSYWYIYYTKYDGVWSDWVLLDTGWESNFTLDTIPLGASGSDMHVAVLLKSGSNYYIEYGKFTSGSWGGFTEFNVTSYLATLTPDLVVNSLGVVGILLGNTSNFTLMKIASGSASYSTIFSGDVRGTVPSICNYGEEFHAICPVGADLKYAYTISGVWQAAITLYNNSDEYSSSIFEASDNAEIGALCVDADGSTLVGFRSPKGYTPPGGTATSNPMFYKLAGVWYRVRRWRRCSK